jgi:hypothetical protein
MYKVFAIGALAVLAGCAAQRRPFPVSIFNDCNPAPLPAIFAGQPTCEMGWHADGWPELTPPNQKSAYISQYPKDCYMGANGFLQCFFVSQLAICDALVVMNDQIEQNGTLFGAVDHVENVSSTTARCWFTKTGVPIQVDFTNRAARADDPPDVSSATVKTAPVSGPYSEQVVSMYTYNNTVMNAPFSGASFNCTWFTNEQMNQENLRDLIVRLNKMKNGTVKSDLAGYVYPKPASAQKCADGTMGAMCTEPTDLTETPYLLNSAQVHHIVPRTARNTSPASCPWGKNETKNAAVISAQLNAVLSNANPPLAEINMINSRPKYPTVTLP